MVDQVNPTGSLAMGPSTASLTTAAPRPAPDKGRAAKIAEAPPPGLGVQPSAEAAKSSEAAMEKLNSYLHQTDTELKFQVDEGSGRPIFKIVSQLTGEVLLQVPSEEMLAMARKVRDLETQMGVSSGVLVDKEG